MSDSVENADQAAQTPSKNRLGQLALLLFLTAVLLLLSWLGWKAWRLYQSGSSLLARQGQFEALSATEWQAIDADEAEALLLGLNADLDDVQAEIAFLLPILPALSSLPQIGPLAAAAPHLLTMADAGVEAAAYGLRAMKPALREMQTADGQGAALPIFLNTIADGQADLAKTSQLLDRAAAARAEISDIEALPWRVRTLIEKGDEWLPLGQDFARFSLVLPRLMGFDEAKRYLIIAQNQDELRPTGGFISGAGYLEIEDGEIKTIDFLDANLVDAWDPELGFGTSLSKPYGPSPLPLEEFMQLDLFLFRDANFWPDFAVSGQKAMDFYAYGRDVAPLDGAIAIDQQFLELLLSAIGPVQIPDGGETINSSNVITSLQDAWTLQDGVSERKAFLGPFAAAILMRVNEGFGEVDPLYLLHQINQSLAQKNLQVYSRDPQIAAMLAANNWDGRLKSGSYGDTLLTVDTNMGYNKANFYIDREVEYAVTLAGEGMSDAVLKISHIHRGEASDEACWQGVQEEYIAGASYLALTDKCYWNYLRVYVPEGSELRSGPDHLIPGQTWYGGYDWQRETETLSELPGFTTFASWMLVPRGEEVRSEFQYRLPESIIRAQEGDKLYTLNLLKQAGVPAYPVQAAITLPPGSTLIEAAPDPIAVDENTYYFTVDLDRDKSIALAYR